MDKIKSFFQNNKIYLTKSQFIELLTAFIAIPIVIGLLVNYSIKCQKTLINVEYSPDLETCYCQASTTQNSIEIQLENNGYLAQITDTNTQLSIEVTVDGPFADVWYPLIEFNNTQVTYMWLTQFPPSIPLSHGNYTINAQYYKPGFGTPFNLCGIYIPISQWDNQINSMKISEFVLNTDAPFQITMEYQSNFNPSSGTYNANNFVIAYNDNCAQKQTAYFQQMRSGYAYPGGICIYLISAEQGYSNSTRFCQQNNNCKEMVDFALSTIDLLRNDLENNVFKSKNPTYCRPDHCSIKDCIGLPLFQILLICVSAITSALALSRFLAYYLYKNKRTNTNTEMTKV